MALDFIIHPEFANPDGRYPYFDKEVYLRYIAHLEKVCQESSLCVIVDEKSENTFADFVPGEQRFSTATYNPDFACGYIQPSDWERFSEIMSGKENDEIRVHGSFYGYCCEHLAIQLFAHLRRAEHWHDWVEPPRYTEKDRERTEYESQLIHQSKGDFLRSNIKYGVVLSYPEKDKMIEEMSLPLPQPAFVRIMDKFFSCLAKHLEAKEDPLPHGRIRDQLTDAGTVIY